jgi:hypothetical protein
MLTPEAADKIAADAERAEFNTKSKLQSNYYIPTVSTEAPTLQPQSLPNGAAAAASTMMVKPIDKYSLLDEGDFVKVYIALEGELGGVKKDDIDVEFTQDTLTVVLTTERGQHRLHVDQLGNMGIEPAGSSYKVTKSRNLILKLEKRNPKLVWESLRPVRPKDTDRANIIPHTS